MREKLKTAIVIILLGLFAVSYIFDFNFKISNSSKSSADHSSISKEIDKIYKTFTKAYSTLDAELVTNLYTADALYLSGEDAIKKGQDEISKGFERYFKWAESENVHLDIAFDIQNRSISDSLVSDVGYYLITTTFPGDSAKEERQSAGKFITILEKNEEGVWQFIADGYNNAPVEAFTKN